MYPDPNHERGDTWLGAAQTADLRSADGIELALGIAALLGRLPGIPAVIPAPGTAADARGHRAGVDAKVLARVRALLAKAESTAFAEEAEALSATGQELVSRYALERDRQEDAAPTPGAVTVRRLWIDPPYVFAKALLLDVVADAGGAPGDLASVAGGHLDAAVRIAGRPVRKVDDDLVPAVVPRLLRDPGRGAPPRSDRLGDGADRPDGGARAGAAAPLRAAGRRLPRALPRCRRQENPGHQRPGLGGGEAAADLAHLGSSPEVAATAS